MKLPLLIAACVALSAAKPEQYREKEDFQYSRSSTDEGSKSGFYGAQRGNMGGNYEKAHNMDTLAQGQMSGLMRQVHGEIGEGANTRNGDVYGSANTRGVYGQGRHDLSNLAGRNFQDEYQGSSSDSSSHSRYRGHSASASSQQADGLSSSYASEDARHSGRGSYGSINSFDTDESRRRHNSHYEDIAEKSAYSKGYHSQSEYNAQMEYERSQGRQQHRDGTYGIENRRADSTHSQGSAESLTVNNNNEDFGQRSGHRKGYLSQSQYSAQEEYERSKAQQQHRKDSYNSDADSRRRVTYHSPMRVVLRPGSRTNIPFTAQTVDDSKTSGLDENSIASDNDKSNSKSKEYQSSFSYHKEWEKRDEKPIDSRSSMTSDRMSSLENNRDEHGHTRINALNSGYDSNNYQGQYERQSHGKTSSNYDRLQSHASSTHGSDEYRYNQNRKTASSGNGLETSNAHLKSLDQSKSTNTNRPKNYESSYSYHKAWERQGDPYVIIPESDTAHGAQMSERLTDTSSKHGTHSSYQRGSQQSKHSQAYYSSIDDDCDEDDHRRIARSTNSRHPEFNSRESLAQETQSSWNKEDFGQQSQSEFGNLEDYGQQNKHNNWANLEDLQQQSQNNWDNLGQQTHGNLEDLQQQSQNNWDNLGQQTHGNLEDMQQQSQNNWDNLGQQTHGNLEDLQQQSQNNWDNLGQQTHGNLEDMQQQSQNNWDNLGQQTHGNLEDLQQQSQNNWDNLGKRTQRNLEDLQQQSQNNWDNLGQQTQGNLEDLQQQSQNDWDNLGQQTQSSWKSLENLGQQTEESLGNLEKNSQNRNSNFGQQTQGSWSNLEQNTQNGNTNFGQQSQGSWGNLEQNTQGNLNFGEHKTFSNRDSLENLNQQAQTQWELSGNRKETEDVNAKNEHDRQYTVVESYDNNKKHEHKPSFNVWDMIAEHDNKYNTRQNSTNKNATLTKDKIDDESDNSMRVIGLTNSNIYKDQSEYNKQKQENQESDIQQEAMGLNIHNIKPVWEQSAEQNNQFETQNTNNNWNFNSSWKTNNSNEEQTFQESQKNLFYHRMQEIHRHISDGTYYPRNNKSNVSKENINSFSQRNYDNNSSLHNFYPELNIHDKNIGINQDNENENTRPISIAKEDIGRGDIGFEEKQSTMPSTTTKHDLISIPYIPPSLYKSPEEIETLSLTRKYDKKPNLFQNNEGSISTSTQVNKHSVILNGDRFENNGYNMESEASNSGYNHRESNDKQGRTSETFDQENLDQQQFEDFGQQSENFDQQSQWENLGQEVQGPWNPSENLMKETQQTQELIDFEKSLRNKEESNNFDSQQHQSSRYSNQEGDQKQKDLSITQESEPLEVENFESRGKIDTASKLESTPPEVQTEKPGFWKSIGNKFTNAKDKVSSWFSSS